MVMSHKNSEAFEVHAWSYSALSSAKHWHRPRVACRRQFPFETLFEVSSGVAHCIRFGHDGDHALSVAIVHPAAFVLFMRMHACCSVSSTASFASSQMLSYSR
jgi:hypothetical protein